MKPILTLVTLLASLFAAQAAENFWDAIPVSPSTTRPAEVRDDYWNSQFLRGNREVAAAKDCQLVFFGDSITWSWSLGPATGKAIWEKQFALYSPINMGNSGDITPVMLFRTTHGNLAFPAGGEPKVAVLLCGTNNFVVNQSDGGKVRWELGPDCRPEDVAAGIRAIAHSFRRALPRTRVVMMGILPVKQPEKRARCEQVNAILASFSLPRDEGVFLVIGQHFLLPGGSLDPQLFTDGTHLTEEGYRAWARSIDPVLTQMLDADPLDPLEIMLIGDGLTEGANPGISYRRHLDGMLRRKGHLIDFIGGRRGHHEGNFEGERHAYDPDHEGHWGKDSAWLAENTGTMLSGKAPEVVVMQLGSAEIALAGEGQDVSDQVIPNLGKIVGALRNAKPQVKVVLTTMHPVPGKTEAVRHLNQAISAYAGANSTERSPVVIADLASGFETSRHLATDGTRPSEDGAIRMAEAIASALDPLFGEVPP